MSRDEPDAAAPDPDELDADALDEGMLGQATLEDDLEPMEEDLEAEELGVSDPDDEDDGLDGDVDDGADAEDDDDKASSGAEDSKPGREVPAGVRPADDEDDDDDDDEELEADLGEILKERLASEDDDEDDDDDDVGIVTGSRSSSKQEDEILCEGCFLLVKPSQFDTRSPEPSCPHCGTPLAY